MSDQINQQAIDPATSPAASHGGLKVGLIPDGARRWARALKVPFDEAYWLSMNNICRLADFLFSEGCQIFCVYGLSKENLQRNAHDLDPVIRAETRLCAELLPRLAEKWAINMELAGHLEQVPPMLAGASRQLHEQSKQYRSGRSMYLLLGYDPLEEVGHALLSGGSDSDWTKRLWVPHRLDLIVRTSGEMRLSNFLPLQSTYAELFFLDKHFNEVTTQDLAQVLRDFRARSRRFGV